MANNKTGFIYYSVETDRYQDIRIKRLKKECGCVGLAVYDYLLCEIYRVKGCFLEWDESTVFDVSEYLGLKENTVREIVNYCCSVGLFNKELLTSGNVLTSSAIQSRFIDWSKKAKRSNIKIPEEINILPEESAKLPEESNTFQEQSQQSKVKESKVKKSKGEKREIAPSEDSSKYLKTENAKDYTPGAENSTPPVAPPPSFTGPPITDVIRWFRGAGGTEEMAVKFWNSYDSVGWMHKGTRIIRWASLAGNFIRNYKDIEDGRKSVTPGDNSPAGGTKSAFNRRNGGFEIVADLLRDELGINGAGRTKDNSPEIQI